MMINNNEAYNKIISSMTEKSSLIIKLVYEIENINLIGRATNTVDTPNTLHQSR